jgi:uncharacterized membrane protein
VTEQGVEAIRADIAKNRGGIALPTVLATLAAVLIGFAMMSFVAANWQDMPRVLRLGLLIGSLWAAYLFAGALFQRGLDGFGHAAVLTGTAVFGASIMLISQMYHMSGNPMDAVLVWAVGALLAGLAFRSNPALAFAMVLVVVWSGMETAQSGTVFWPFLLGWAVVSAAFWLQRWAPGFQLSAVTLTGFIVSLGYLLHTSLAQELVTALGVLLGAAALIGSRMPSEWAGLARAIVPYTMVMTFAGLFAQQFFETTMLDHFILLAILTLVLTLAAIWWGLMTQNRGALWLGYTGFSAEILGIYTKTIGTLLGSSVFFLSAGLIVAGLAYLAYRLHARGDSMEAV